MPRRSSGGRSAPAHASVRDPPKPAVRAPPPPAAQSVNGSMGGDLGAAVADGLAFGTGSAVAHRAVGAVMGPRVIHHETISSAAPAATPAPASNTGSLGSNACGGQFKALQDL